MATFVFETAWGWCAARVTETGVAALELPMGSRERALRAAAKWEAGTGEAARTYALDARPATVARELGRLAGEVVRQVRAYFDGRLQEFDLPLDWSGATDFRRAVWQALLALPFGATTSYGEMARGLGRPRGARAVGGAVGANPTPLLAPCHRVVGSHGELGGFSAEGGVATKKRLLHFEAKKE
jgi:methylated-DNA-[protein]-cysteine S-methyltransferase